MFPGSSGSLNDVEIMNYMSLGQFSRAKKKKIVQQRWDVHRNGTVAIKDI